MRLFDDPLDPESRFPKFLSYPRTSLIGMQKRENHSYDISLVYLFFLKLLEQPSFFCVLSTWWLCWTFPWHLCFDNSELEQLGFYSCWIPLKNRWHFILLKRPCYRVWEKQHRNSSCASIWGTGVILCSFTWWGRLQGECITIWTSLELLSLLNHHKTKMWSRMSPPLFSW